ncbi:hypothetical protein SAMN05421812_12268 [Asanoa hainanensis]|uniref:Uncharacterized protein n=1 Tax=Asanoa hainanensis TaxID=560556 RepID=A0A239PEE8_9ACTN|nr:hypothetical protein [Asanoa hainanensis]SNT65410.1 hypothetical protein SAMN05421812_12268 [Asanoa hainanensis]
MSEFNPLPPERPLRHGEAWSWTDYEQLLQGVFDGLSVRELAAKLRRTPGAVRAQLGQLVPDEAKAWRTAERIDWLRRCLAENPEYDWQAVLNSHLTDPFRLWSGTEECLLRDGWENRTALPDLVATLQISEPTIVHHLIKIGLAAHVGEVVDRLGATAGGSVEARARLLRAELSEAIYVVIVEGSRRPIASLHHSAEGAEKAMRETIGNPTVTEPRRWVMRRTLDGRSAGQIWSSPSRRH